MIGFASVNSALTDLRMRKHNIARHMRVFSHTTPEERLALFQIARRLPNGAVALEIGSHIGSSALFLCQALREKNGHLFCVDTWMNDTMPDGMRDNFAEFLGNTREFSEIITPVRKRSEQLSPSDVPGQLDMVFIDGDHSEDAVRRDVRLTSEWIKPGGVLAFHDVTKEHPGVAVVLGETLASRRWELEGLIGSLGWLRRKTQP